MVPSMPHVGADSGGDRHDYAGRLKVMKLNVDEAMNSAGRYRVQGIPTLLLFKNGRSSSRLWERCLRSRSPRRWSGTSLDGV